MTSRPNILLIYTDQQRYDTIAALGNSQIHTPNLDRMVQEGVAFTHATTPSPVCMPARWSLQSGQWPSTHRCYSNHHLGSRPQTDIPNMLRDAGYVTGLAGKNHTFLGPDDFEFWAEDPVPTDHPDWPEVVEWSKLRRERFPRLAEEPVPGHVEATAEHATTNAALAFVKTAMDSDKPFFLLLSYLYPHPPFEAPEPFHSMYRNLPLPEAMIEPNGLENAKKPFRQQFKQRNDRAFLDISPGFVRRLREVYYGMVSLVDQEIGRILAFLDKNELTENTLLIFTSDHGDYLGDHGMITKSPAMYDCLVRIPFIVRWPGHCDENRLDQRFVSHIDFMPTFAEVAGTECPEQAQGKSFLSILNDQGDGELIRNAAYSEYGVPGTPYTQSSLEAEGLHNKRYANPYNPNLPWEGNPVSLAGRFYMIRTHNWKFVEEPGGTSELYDLVADPYEMKNLCGQPEFQKIEEELAAQLEEWKTSLNSH